MFKTLRISFSLKNTYRVNSILYSLSQMPVVRKIIPSDIYSVKGLKILANVAAVIGEILSAFSGKLLYFLLLVMCITDLYELSYNSEGPMALHLMLFLSVAGACVNTCMFTPSRDKYYALVTLKIDAKQYTLVNYLYSMLKIIVAYGVLSFVFFYPLGVSAFQCVLIPLFVAGIKTAGDGISLLNYEKHSTVKNENNPGILSWICIVTAFLFAFGLPFAGLIFPSEVSTVIMALITVAGCAFVPKILNFPHYRAMYRELLSDTQSMQTDKTLQTKLRQDKNRDNISSDNNPQSSKKGLEFLNELFIKRHKKILWTSALKTTFIAGGIFVAAVVFLFVKPEMKENINGMLLTYLPYFVFIMYLINRGSGFTEALFVNCDRSLMCYPFFRNRDFILRLFTLRLWEIIKINLLPSAVIGFSLSALMFLSGGTDNPLNYAVLFVSVVALSIFFSVHYLTLYYLLQPYNAETEVRSGAYKVITGLTYLLCYGMIQIKMSTLVFGLITIIFCVMYCITACLLVYRFAPSTFRIRK